MDDMDDMDDMDSMDDMDGMDSMDDMDWGGVCGKLVSPAPGFACIRVCVSR